jgi:isoleucyl-tRNA synthetase
MNDWLTNMGDWNISRKRYYGMPLPFYPCSCGHITVVGSKDELREKAVDPAQVDALPELHRPWVDEVKIKCPHCGKEVSRVSDIGDVWLDAGIVPFSTLGYFTDREAWEKNFPAEWVTEMHEQVRLWFYSMLFMSTVLVGKAPYERVVTNGMVVAEDGSKFSKTGFMIKFDEAAEKIGADTVRYLYASAPNTNDVRFGYNLGDEARRKMLGFWNIYTFFDTYAQLDKPNFAEYKVDFAKLTPMDKWLVVRTNDFLKKATANMDEYKSFALIKDFEVFVDDISNWYIRANRRRFWKTEDQQDKMVAYWTLFNALKVCVQTMAPIMPFMTEYIWQNLIKKCDSTVAESVHLSDWPTVVEGIEDDGIIEQTALVRDVIATAMRLRNEQQIKVRQPLAKLFVCCDADKADKIKTFEKNILDELNIKAVEYIGDITVLEDQFLAVNFKVAGAALKQNVNKMKQTLEGLSSDDMKALTAAVVAGGEVSVPGWDEKFDASIFAVQSKTKEGVVSAEFTQGAVVALDIVLTEELLKEGVVRDIIRQCQVARKEAGYQVEQRIKASITVDDEFVVSALTEKLDYISAELLADAIVINEAMVADYTSEFTVNDKKITVSVVKGE